MYVCKTLFKHASLDNYLQLIFTRGVTQIKYISTINYKKNNLTLPPAPDEIIKNYTEM